MKKFRKVLLAGAALVAALSFAGCSLVEDLTKSKYEAENTVEDAYPDLAKEVDTPITTEAELKTAMTEIVSSYSTTSLMNMSTAKTGTEAAKQVKEFYSALDAALTPFLNGTSKTIDFDKSIDMADIDFSDLLEVALSVYNDMNETTYTMDELYAALAETSGLTTDSLKSIVEQVSDAVTLNKFLVALDLDVNTAATTEKETAAGIDTEETISITVKDIEDTINEILNVYLGTANSAYKMTISSPVKAVSVYLDSTLAGKIMGDEYQKSLTSYANGTLYLPVVKNFKTTFTSSAAVALVTDSKVGGYISAEITAKISQNQFDAIEELATKYENGDLTSTEYDTQLSAYLDDILTITVKSKCKKTYTLGKYNYSEFVAAYNE